jgi:hypothetical protein
MIVHGIASVHDDIQITPRSVGAADALIASNSRPMRRHALVLVLFGHLSGF